MFALLHALGADFHTGAIGKFGPLEVGLLAGNAAWIVLGGADAVRVAARAHPRFIANWTEFHNEAYAIMNP